MFMVGILILVMSVLVFTSTLPAVQTTIAGVRGCDSLNCVGFVDSTATGTGCSATNTSYLPGGDQSNSLSCTIMDLFLPFLILGILIGLITALLHGRLGQTEPQYGPQY